MNTLVMKFGGSSVGTTTALTQVLSIVLQERERWQRMLLVVSALEGVTDALIEAAHLAQLSNRRGYRRIVASLRTRHLALIEHLPLGPTERAALQADIDRLLFDMLDTCQALAGSTGESAESDKIDAVVGVGERLSARIVAALLRQNNLRGVAIDATDLIITDNVYGNASVNLPLTRTRITQQLVPMLSRSIIPVITGFIGATAAGKPTTLGRGGSDYTASVLAATVDANEVWIWTDVDGMMSTDPREISEAQVIAFLSYDEVAEMAFFGARILHPRMIAPLREKRIPLRVRNVFKPQQAGTRISDAASTDIAIKAVTAIQGIGLTAESSGPLGPMADLIDEILFTTTGNHADVMITSQSTRRSFLCFIIPTTAGPDALHSLRRVLDEQLPAHNAPISWTVSNVSIVTAIGARLDEIHPLACTIFESLNGIRVLAVAQGAGRCSLSLVVDSHDAEHALAQIHSVIVGKSGCPGLRFP